MVKHTYHLDCNIKLNNVFNNIHPSIPISPPAAAQTSAPQYLWMPGPSLELPAVGMAPFAQDLPQTQLNQRSYRNPLVLTGLWLNMLNLLETTVFLALKTSAVLQNVQFYPSDGQLHRPPQLLPLIRHHGVVPAREVSDSHLSGDVKLPSSRSAMNKNGGLPGCLGGFQNPPWLSSKGCISSSGSWQFLAAAMASRRAPHVLGKAPRHQKALGNQNFGVIYLLYY